MDPVSIGLGALKYGPAIIGGLGKLFGGGRPKYNSRYIPSKFQYLQDENDPELLLRRRRIFEEAGQDRANTVDEISRAGLLGSSASFGQLNEQQSRQDRVLEDTTADVFSKRRMEALDLYKDQENFKRRMALLERDRELGAMEGEHQAGLGALSELGNFAGGWLSDYTSRPKLPKTALSGASNFEFMPPPRRGRYL